MCDDLSYLLAEVAMMRTALRQILEDEGARILDSHRDDGWAALGNAKR